MYVILCFTFLLTAAPPTEFKVFKDHYSALKNILSAQNLSQYFVSANLISFQDEEEICAASTSAKKATILLQRIASPLESGHSFYFHKMLEIMDAHGNIATRDLAHKMQADLVVERSKPKGTPTSQATITSSSDIRPNLQHQPMLPHGTRGMNSPPATVTTSNPSAVTTPPGDVDTTGEGSEHVDLKGVHACMHVCSVCECVCACVRVCVRACVSECVHACVRACVHSQVARTPVW